LIIRDIYALSSNDETKFADWVTYRLDKETVTGDVETGRNWKVDPWLEENETLEPEDYTGAHDTLETDRGHQAPLASFKGTGIWTETNFLSNITPQKSELNQGPWRVLENKVRELVKKGHTVYVITGPYYDRDMPLLPNADEPHKLPSGYWKIVISPEDKNPETMKCASFLFNQDTPGNAKVTDYLCKIDDIEGKTHLDFFRELPDIIEEKIEGNLFQKWAQENF